MTKVKEEVVEEEMVIEDKKELKEEKKELVTTENKVISLRTSEGLIAVAQNYLKKNGDVVLPPNYDVNDAVKALYLQALQTVDKQKRPILEVCTKESIEQVVQKYVSKGLNIAKNQCYLVCYGNTLSLSESYFGKQKQAKAYSNISINSDVIYRGEEVRIEKRNDGSKIIHHTPDFSKFNIDSIVGAYAVAINEKNEVIDSDIMTMEEIKRSWAKSQSGGSVHKEFPVEMCRKTVIGRLAKKFINTSDDSTKFGDINEEIYDNNEIDTNVIIEDTTVIADKKTTTNGTELSISELDDNKTKEIYYSEFKNNKTKYRAVPNSYDDEKKTIKVYC